MGFSGKCSGVVAATCSSPNPAHHLDTNSLDEAACSREICSSPPCHHPTCHPFGLATGPAADGSEWKEAATWAAGLCTQDPPRFRNTM
eukprot:CAMPEP_0204361922 /NCGR_PEP_ID=MMETSP0469-20131031/39182_1 /ASSEMBLY_ACC=CAM_ASM_000384 /TAXON_ID=2969 /ORGANISM="Oxyrrhis marina" /LENGTH=87 /DNA_ID=CAMNT_0051350397 /DNA_START=332 /DNA_END=595 /DNA_ORIENTATION=+